MGRPEPQYGNSNSSHASFFINVYWREQETTYYIDMEDLSLFDYFIKCLKKYACFKGRARRKEYWGFMVFYDLIFLLVPLVPLLNDTSSLIGLIFVDLIFVLILLDIPRRAVFARRSHDIGGSGWELLFDFRRWKVMTEDSDPDENEYGPCPKTDSKLNSPTENMLNIENLTLFGYFLKCWKKYACFKGRARKQEFWGYILFLFILNVLIFNALVIIDNIASGYYEDYINMVYEGLLILQILPTLAVTTRRLHDIDNNAVYNLLYIVPFGFIFLFIMCSRDSDIYENEYGPNLEGDDISNNSVDSEKDESENKS
jgi:uncharacterized membrane protein YhaH (DUF805 family)